MTNPRHYIGKICDCENTSKRMANIRNYDPKSDFVPLEAVLEDDSETANSSCANSSGYCCLHGVPCAAVSLLLFVNVGLKGYCICG